MNWKIAALTLAVLAATPLALGAPNVQTGQQAPPGFWGTYTPVAVQANTGFDLVGVIGDHDAFFYNAAGGLIQQNIACGPEFNGHVPANAASGRVYLYATFSLIGTCAGQNNNVPTSAWVYVDGL